MFKKTIIIPCFNEKKTILELLRRVKNNLNNEDNIIIIDDGSTDGTKDLLKELDGIDHNIKILFHNKNLGKGAAIQSAMFQKLNDIIIIQDADLEYNPEDYSRLLLPFLETEADVVYGSRFLGGSKYVRIHFFWHFAANKMLTFFCNIFANLNLTDMETGYKAFKKNVIKELKLKEKSFGIEPEITLKLAKKKFKFFEVPISYNGRSYEEGKKIRLKDAFIAVYCIIRYGVFN
jgi:glycosyltransferase involved in cell wall biosynthesis